MFAHVSFVASHSPETMHYRGMQTWLQKNYIQLPLDATLSLIILLSICNYTIEGGFKVSVKYSIRHFILEIAFYLPKYLGETASILFCSQNTET